MAFFGILDFLFVLLKDFSAMDAAVIAPVTVNIKEIVPAAFPVIK